MQHCVELRRAGNQPSLPLLGSFCINQLGLQLKVPGGCVAGLLGIAPCCMDGNTCEVCGETHEESACLPIN